MDNRLIAEPHLTYSRQLRKEHNPWEIKLWQRLGAGRFFGLKFKRQVQIGPFIFDFSCRSKMVVIELDGGQHSEADIADKDLTKQSYAMKEGYKVLRFWNKELDKNMHGVLETIMKTCEV